MAELPLTGTLDIWGFCTLLKSTSAEPSPLQAGDQEEDLRGHVGRFVSNIYLFSYRILNKCDLKIIIYHLKTKKLNLYLRNQIQQRSLHRDMDPGEEIR